jgi:hypothetical protein
MTHFDEMTCLLYLDGQLDTMKARELELHTRSCTPCRALLAALQRESALLHQAMVEQEESVPARLLAPPGREGVPWGWITTLAAAGLGAFTVWNQVIEPWQASLSQAGFGGENLLAMLFFSGVFWKGWSQMTIVFQILAAMTLGAPLALYLWRKRHRLSPVTMVLYALALFFATPQGAAAAEIKKAERYSIPSGETVHADLIIVSGPVRIEGTLDGDLIAFCESLTIEGHVTGDVIVFTRRLTMNGTVDGSVRTFANTIDIGGKVSHSVMAFAEGLELRQGSDVGWGALMMGKSVDLAGRVGRDVTVHADRTGLEGYVGGSFDANGGNLSIASTAEVLGKATYRGRKEPTVEAGAKLASPLEKIVPTRRPRYYTFEFYWDTLLGYASVLALGAVILLISPPAFRAVTREGRRPGALIGAVVVLAVPIAAIIACITLVGFALGMVSAVLWLLLLYIAQIYVGGAIGEMILGSASTRGAQFGRLAAGLALLRIASALLSILLPGGGPWFLFWLIIASWGIGAITLAIYERARWKPSLAPPAAEAAV